MIRAIRLVVIACAGLAASSSFASAQGPVPGDLSLPPPGPEVPAAIARFSGAWAGGAWDGAVPAALIVEALAADGQAVVGVAWGDGGSLLAPPGWQRLSATIASGRLTLASEETVQDYEFDASG